jgi:hypothetical protein
MTGFQRLAPLLLGLAAPCAGGAEVHVADKVKWLDKTQEFVYDRLWRSAMVLDRRLGSTADESVYRETYGSIAPSLLWDETRGFQPNLRFTINAPLPGLDEHVYAVFGKVNPDEFITERAQSSGSQRRQFGVDQDDQTILGLAYRTRWRDDQDFGLGLGVRIRSPLDPYVKADYTFARGTPSTLLFTYKQTLFWQRSERAGTTSRMSFDRFLTENDLLRLTVSGTVSQESAGLRGYAAATLLRSLQQRRAIVGNVSIDWESRAPVALQDFGAVVAYRQSVYRDWLILELRTSLNWPKAVPSAARNMSWGLGVGAEMLFGTTQFQARPVTF